MADARPKAGGRVWLKYVIVAAVPRIKRRAAPAATFQTSPSDMTNPIRRQATRGSRQGMAGATSGAGTGTSSALVRARAGTATSAVRPAAATTTVAARNITRGPNAS